MLAAWHASLEVGHPIANKEFLLGAFRGLGEHRREALKIAAGFKGDDAFEAGRERGAGARHGAALALARARWRSSPPRPSSCTAGTAWLRQLGGRSSRARRCVLLAGCAVRRLDLPSSASPGPGASARTGTLEARQRRRHASGCRGIGRVRLIGIDTPEVYGRVECFGREASTFVKRAAPARGARALPAGRRGARPLRARAGLRLAAGRPLPQRASGAGGYAQPLTIPPNVEFADRFVAAARRGALSAGAGLGPPRSRRPPAALAGRHLLVLAHDLPGSVGGGDEERRFAVPQAVVVVVT